MYSHVRESTRRRRLLLHTALLISGNERTTTIVNISYVYVARKLLRDRGASATFFFPHAGARRALPWSVGNWTAAFIHTHTLRRERIDVFLSHSVALF